MTLSEKEWNDLADYRDSLEHYGRKGMRWGQHIFGKERASAKTSGSSSVSKTKATRRQERAKARLEKAKAKAEKEAAKKQAQAEKEAAKKEAKRQANLRDPTKLYKHRNEYTQEEIQAALKQFEWEQKLSNYSQQRLENGAKFINTMFTYANNSINLYNAAARIANSIGDEDSLPYIKQIPGSDKKKDKK